MLPKIPKRFNTIMKTKLGLNRICATINETHNCEITSHTKGLEIFSPELYFCNTLPMIFCRKSHWYNFSELCEKHQLANKINGMAGTPGSKIPM